MLNYAFSLCFMEKMKLFPDENTAKYRVSGIVNTTDLRKTRAFGIEVKIRMDLFCYERDFKGKKNGNMIYTFNSTSRYFDDLLNIDNIYFEQMVNRIYPAEHQLNKAYSSDTEALFLDVNLSTSNGIVSTKIYDKRDDPSEPYVWSRRRLL